MNTLSSQWLANPYWQAMDMTARGFHTQLVLLAVQNGGSLPDDEELWKQWLNIPSMESATGTPISQGFPSVLIPWIKNGAPGKLEALGGAQLLTEHYWKTLWLPSILPLWEKVKPGMVSCEMVKALMQQGVTPTETPVLEVAKPAKPTVKKKKNNKIIPASSYPIERLIHSVNGFQKAALPFLFEMPEKLTSKEDVLARWHNPVERKQRLDIWSIGEQLLNMGEKGSSSGNRTYIASLIKTFGEAAVLVALTEMAKRNTVPANPRALLRGILMRSNKSTLNAQKARNNRVNPPL